MKLDLSALSLRLPRGAALRLRAARGVELTGRGGRLWLTEEGWPEDVFLRRGERYVIRGEGRVVVSADEDADLELREGAGSPPRPA